MRGCCKPRAAAVCSTDAAQTILSQLGLSAAPPAGEAHARTCSNSVRATAAAAVVPQQLMTDWLMSEQQPLPGKHFRQLLVLKMWLWSVETAWDWSQQQQQHHQQRWLVAMVQVDWQHPAESLSAFSSGDRPTSRWSN